MNPEKLLATVRAALRKAGSLRLVDTRRLYALWERRHLARLLGHYDVDCVFDVGANYGQYARMLRTKVGFKGLIVSFEPLPDAAAELRRLSARDPRWVVEEKALSSENGTRTFHVMADSQFSSLNAPRHDEVALFQGLNRNVRDIRVATETLDSAYARLSAAHRFRRPFLKLDTQGHDVEILSGSASAVRQFVGLQSELAVKKLYANAVDFREALALYESLGFQLSAFVPNNVGHFPLLIEMDCIMIRRDLVADGDLVFNT